jgi:hypothetical protein
MFTFNLLLLSVSFLITYPGYSRSIIQANLLITQEIAVLPIVNLFRSVCLNHYYIVIWG